MAAAQKARPEGHYEEITVHIRRTAKVVKGGRVFGFSALVVVGDKNGRVGVGKGNAKEVPDAIRKATEQARRSLVRIPLNGNTLHHEVIAHHGASKVFMKPASEGTGIIAGGAMRQVFEVLGVQNVLAKCFGSTNPLNVVRATIKALNKMRSPEYTADKRGKTVAEILGIEHEKEAS